MWCECPRMPDHPTILVMDHDEENFRWCADVLRQVDPSTRVVWACGTADAAAYLERREGYDDRKFFPAPDLIFVALRPPEANTLAFVRWMRAQTAWGDVPTLGLSACGDDFDASRALSAGLTAFLHQPCEEEKFATLLRGVLEHWREGGAARRAPWPGAVALPESCAA